LSILEFRNCIVGKIELFPENSFSFLGIGRTEQTKGWIDDSLHANEHLTLIENTHLFSEQQGKEGKEGSRLTPKAASMLGNRFRLFLGFKVIVGAIETRCFTLIRSFLELIDKSFDALGILTIIVVEFRQRAGFEHRLFAITLFANGVRFHLIFSTLALGMRTPR
jgi:hypothetical protein